MERMQALERKVKEFERKVGKPSSEILRLVAEADAQKKNWPKITHSFRMGRTSSSISAVTSFLLTPLGGSVRQSRARSRIRRERFASPYT
jgi:hypothetical protein